MSEQGGFPPIRFEFTPSPSDERPPGYHRIEVGVLNTSAKGVQSSVAVNTL